MNEVPESSVLQIVEVCFTLVGIVFTRWQVFSENFSFKCLPDVDREAAVTNVQLTYMYVCTYYEVSIDVRPQVHRYLKMGLRLATYLRGAWQPALTNCSAPRYLPPSPPFHVLPKSGNTDCQPQLSTGTRCCT